MDTTADTTATSGLTNKQRWGLLAGLVGIPVYVLPVGIWGLRAVRPRLLRDALSGAITLGMVSLVQMARVGLRRRKSPKFAGFHPITPDEFAASAASAH